MADLPLNVPGKQLTRGGWSRGHLWAALGAAALCMLVAGNAWADLLSIAWRDEESSHALLVPVMAAWLVWVRRGRIRRCTPAGRLIGTLCLATGWALWSIGYRYQIQSFWHGGAVVMTIGGVLTVLGVDAFLSFLPVFCVMVFLVPVPATVRHWIAVPLQQFTAQMTQGVAEVIGIGVERRGSLLMINGKEVAIAEACNGMRMVFTLFMACYVFAFVTPLHGYVRFLVLATSPLVAVVCNVARLVPTVWMYGHMSPSAAEVFHDASGWAMLLIAFVGLMGIVKLLRWAMIPVTPFALAGGY
jgi:exosortase